MADNPPQRSVASGRPQFVMTLWRDANGTWQGRLKSLQDGAEQIVSDVRDLPSVLGGVSARKENHA